MISLELSSSVERGKFDITLVEENLVLKAMLEENERCLDELHDVAKLKASLLVKEL